MIQKIVLARHAHAHNHRAACANCTWRFNLSQNISDAIEFWLCTQSRRCTLSSWTKQKRTFIGPFGAKQRAWDYSNHKSICQLKHGLISAIFTLNIQFVKKKKKKNPKWKRFSWNGRRKMLCRPCSRSPLPFWLLITVKRYEEKKNFITADTFPNAPGRRTHQLHTKRRQLDYNLFDARDRSRKKKMKKLRSLFESPKFAVRPFAAFAFTFGASHVHFPTSK